MSGQPRRLLGDIIAEKQAQQQSSGKDDHQMKLNTIV